MLESVRRIRFADSSRLAPKAMVLGRCNREREENPLCGFFQACAEGDGAGDGVIESVGIMRDDRNLDGGR